MLFKRVMERPPEHGGGTRRRFMVIDPVAEDPFRAPSRPRARRPRADDWVTLKMKLHHTAQSKATGYSALRLMIEQGRLWIPRSAEQLIRELLTLRIDLSPAGNERVQAASGHDDASDSLVAALRPYAVQGEKGWRVRLAELAEPGRRLPDAPLPPGLAALPTVPGPGGLAIPQRPVWQSVSGSELTLPAGFDPDRRPESPVIRDARERVRAAMEAVDQGGR